MPHIPVHPSAQKRHRQNLKRNERRSALKASVRTVVKSAALAIQDKDLDGASAKLRDATKALYKAASKGAFHRNTARRQVARLASRLHRAKAGTQTT